MITDSSTFLPNLTEEPSSDPTISTQNSTVTEQMFPEKSTIEPALTKTISPVSKSPPVKTVSPIFSTPVSTSGSYKRFKSYHQTPPHSSAYQPYRHSAPNFYNQPNRPPYQHYVQAPYPPPQQYLHYAQPAYPYQSSQPVMYHNNNPYQIQPNQFQNYQHQLISQQQQQQAAMYSSAYQQPQHHNYYQNQQVQQSQQPLIHVSFSTRFNEPMLASLIKFRQLKINNQINVEIGKIGADSAEHNDYTDCSLLYQSNIV